MTKEALKDLLEVVEAAIKAGDWKVDGACDPDLAIRRAREALAQEQEPVATVESVATVVSESGSQEITMSWWHEPALPVGTKLYTTPPQRSESSGKPAAWVGLTDEERQDIALEVPINAVLITEAKLKEKNT